MVVNQISQRIVLHSHVEDNLFVRIDADVQHDFNFKINSVLQIYYILHTHIIFYTHTQNINFSIYRKRLKYQKITIF